MEHDELGAVGDLAFGIASKYGDASFSDEDAAAACWTDVVNVGFPGVMIPEEFGGAGEGVATLAVIMERSGSAGYPFGKLILGQAVVGAILRRNADEAMKQRWLPAVASGDARFCFAMTEYSAGQNAMNMKATARRTPSGWTLNGEKSYVGGLLAAKAMLVAVQTPEHGGVSLFLVEDPASRIDHDEVPVGHTPMETTYRLFMDDLELPDDALVGEVGRGLRYAFDGINPDRILTGSQSVGLGRWGMHKAAAYARDRVVFDGPIGAYQAIQHPLARSYAELEAAWLTLQEAARAYDEADPDAALKATVARLLAAEAGVTALDRALQVHGGMGYEASTRIIERLLLNRYHVTIPGTPEMALNFLAQKALGLPKSY